MDIVSQNIKDSLHYAEERNGYFTLFYSNKYTGISVSRSHEGYNHFAQWYIKVNGKIKKSYEIREREDALHEGFMIFIESFGDKLLEIVERDMRRGA